MFSAGKDTVSVFKVSWMNFAKYHVDALPQYDVCKLSEFYYFLSKHFLIKDS